MTSAQKSVSHPKEKKHNALKLFVALDRLSFIQRSIEKFLEKWTKKRLNNLENSQQLEKRGKIIGFARWINRFLAVGTSALVLYGYPKVGGGIGLLCPLVEALFFGLHVENEAKKREWEGFIEDCEELGDNLDELTLVIESLTNSLIKKPKLVNHLKEIRKKIYDFLKEYDKNKDGRVDASELKIDKFAWNLKTEWGRKNINNKKAGAKTSRGKKKNLKEIMRLVRNLQIEVVDYD